MLTFTEDKKHFIIEETEVNGTYTKSIRKIYYTKDIEYKKANLDPWRKTTIEEKKLFNQFKEMIMSNYTDDPFKNKKMNIIINTRFSAVHLWPDCDLEEVHYLRFPHRHEFHVKVKAPVSHENRDIEFILLKNKIERWISENWDKKNLKQKSCETMCNELMLNFPELNYVSVLEDGENGSEVLNEK